LELVLILPFFTLKIVHISDFAHYIALPCAPRHPSEIEPMDSELLRQARADGSHSAASTDGSALIRRQSHSLKGQQRYRDVKELRRFLRCWRR
jgi:hypothetical protein